MESYNDEQFPYEAEEQDFIAVENHSRIHPTPVQSFYSKSVSMEHDHTEDLPSLRRCISVEVLLWEDAEENHSPVYPTPAQSFYSKSVTINSLDLATPIMPSKIPSIQIRVPAMQMTDSATPVTPGPTPGFVEVSSVTEETCASFYRNTPSGNANDENSLELVFDMEMSESGFNVYEPTESQYIDHLYSSRSTAMDHAAPPLECATPSSESESKVAELRRSSVVDILRPMTALTVHAVAFGCWYFSRH